MLRLGRLKVLLLVIGFFICSTTQAACVEDYLSKNQNSGRILVTAGGFIFEPLAGDNITAMLWLPMDDLLVCGPQLFPYGGKTYEIYKVTNIDDKESVSAMKIAGRGLAAGGRPRTRAEERRQDDDMARFLHGSIRAGNSVILCRRRG